MDGVIIIPGDHRDPVKEISEGKGYKVKVAGG
jgi:translation initiation factor 1 (eIF-1/SUI1)